jgi:hypothetical protein
LAKPSTSFRPVAAGDLELGGADQRLRDPDLALVALGVDDPDSAGRDGEMVDVRATPDAWLEWSDRESADIGAIGSR